MNLFKLNKVLGCVFLDQDGGRGRLLAKVNDEEDFHGFTVEELKKGLMLI